MMNKKGFIHALEGIIAAILLVSYLGTILQYPTTDFDWSGSKQKQVSREYFSAFNDADLSWLIVDDRSYEFVEITRYFLGMGRSYGLYTKGLLAKNIVVGILSNESEVVSTNSVLCSTVGVPSEPVFDCRNNTFRGYQFVITDNDTNGDLDYDSLYLDADGDGLYDSAEGRWPVSSTINVSGEIWVLSSIDNITFDVEFVRAHEFVRYLSKISDVVINGRKTVISFRIESNLSDFMDVDILLIPQFMNLVNLRPKLEEFLDDGGSLIEVANITKNDLDEVQTDKNIFALRYVDADMVSSIDDNMSFISKDGFDMAYKIGKYFKSTNIVIETKTGIFEFDPVWINSGPDLYDYNCYLDDSDIYLGYVNCTNIAGPNYCSTYTIDGIINYVNDSLVPPVYCRIGTVSSYINYYGEVYIRNLNYSVLVVNTTDEYDGIFIDLNRDRNLTNDGGMKGVGDIVEIESTNFTIMDIYRNGTGIELRPSSEHKFVHSYPDKLYSIHNDTKYVVVGSDAEYNVTPFLIGENLSVGTIIGRGTCDLMSLMVGDYMSNNTPWNFSFPFTISRVSSDFVAINIDLNSNGMCDELDEGPFYSGELVRFGPEYYQVNVAKDGSHVNWTLHERWVVPTAIVNYNNNGRKTAWVSGNLTSDDEWHLIRSIILWASNHDAELTRSSETSKSVLVRNTVVEHSDVVQPYNAYFRVGV